MRVVLFTSKNCKACPAMKANLKKAEIPFSEVDVESKTGLVKAAQLRIMHLPTLFLFDNDIPIKSFMGALPFSEVMKIKNKYLR